MIERSEFSKPFMRMFITVDPRAIKVVVCFADA